MSIFQRQINLIGDSAHAKLQNAKVAVFGLGGVGSYTVEALARAGVGTLVICDNDTIAPHNINRQLYALHSTIGKTKTEVCKARCEDINPNIKIEVKNLFFDGATANEFDFSSFDYIADCIDSVTSKLLLCELANANSVKIISSMGTGNKLNCEFKISDISKTKVCPLARVMRRELAKRGIKKLKCVYSEEQPVMQECEDNEKRRIPSSISFVPSSCGLLIAGEIIKDIINS
jgi:tRNA A37 threonylcarbamoyladenosine dehydratase